MFDPDRNHKEHDNEEEPTDSQEDSFADLLEATDSEPIRVDQRDDEPDSGLVNLADMVTRISSSPSPSPLPDTTPLGIATVSPSSAPPPPMKKSSQVPMFALIGVVLVSAVAVIAFTRGGEGESEKLSDLAAQLDQMKQEEHRRLAAAQNELAESKAQAEAAAKRAALEKAALEKVALEKAVLEKAVQEQAESEEVEKVAPDEKKPRPAIAQQKNKSAKRETKATKSVSSAARTDSKPTKSKPAEKAVKTSGNELDTLLGGSGKKEPKKKEKATDSDLPKRPSKVDVKAAMGPVSSKARACSRYSTGTVQLKVTVGANGRIKLSKSMGSFAGTTAGKCVEMLARTAKFSAFKDPSFTFTYPVVLK
ncbi:MAG: hypothetical protein GY854_21435 [Deltaproteobacteria bacterium]|nr:hypothetical protein [Deltaproteobacteria bacterium]